MSLTQPVDDHMIVGSYSPVTLDIVRRTYVLSLVLRIDDGSLYNKMQLDPAGGSAWVAKLMREANIKLQFSSPVDAGSSGVAPDDVHVPYSFSLGANETSGDDANIVWTVRPLNFRAGRQITLAATGMFVSNTVAGKQPISITLVNKTASY